MINIYLNQVEKELDQMIVEQKTTSDSLRIAEDAYSVIDETMGHEALKVIALFNVLKKQTELEQLHKNIELAHKTIKSLHNVRLTQRKDRINERSSELSNE